MNSFDDKEWLEDEAWLGPWTRLALGVLLANEKRSWFKSPHVAAIELELCVPKHGLVEWGGDAAILTAQSWLPPEVAIEIGQIMREVRRKQPLRVQIQREVFNWDFGSLELGDVLDDLSETVGYERVSLEWPKNVRRAFPRGYDTDSETLSIGASSELSVIAELTQRQTVPGRWAPQARVSDVYVVGDAEDFDRFDGARMVIAFSGLHDYPDIAEQLVMLRDEKFAKCVVEVDADEAVRSKWLSSFFGEWSRSGVFLDDALAIANEESGARSRVLSSTKTFILQSSNILRPFSKREPTSYDRSSGGTARANDMRVAYSRSADDLVKFSIPMGALDPPPQLRVLDAVVSQVGKVVDRLPLTGLITLSLSVLIKGPWHSLVPVFPDDDVEWDGDSKELQAHMFEFGRGVVSQVMVVPRKGNSMPCGFDYELDGRGLDLRFMLTDGARILQTARLKAEPGEKIVFYVEVVAQSVLRTKEAFDVALLVNDSLGSSPSLTSISADAIQLTALSETEADRACKRLLELLYDLVNRPKQPLAPAMMKLANHGRLFMNHLKASVDGWPDRIERVQLLTQADAFFPMEYLYDGEIPDSPEAALCEQRHDCLTKGEAIPACPIREACVQLCPMGFLGLSAIVERHTWRTDRRKGIWMSARIDQVGRSAIKDLSNAALSASRRADRFSPSDVPEGTEIVKVADIEKLLERECLTDWEMWKVAIEEHSPSLLVMLLHTDEAMLSIGDDKWLNLGALKATHVGGGKPVVVAIGCNTGASEMAGSHLPALLLEKGAQLVFAAMTNVLGRHAVRAARDVTAGLREASGATKATTAGELISKVRGRLLRDDIALGLTLIAFGDADVVLGGK